MALRAHLCSYACGVALAAIFAGASPVALARSTAPQLPEITVAELPPEGRDLLDRIKANRSFRYERDGAVFGNRERILPLRPRGYYREYTVRTPGSANRGARRIVCGGVIRTPADSRGTPEAVRETPASVRAAPDGGREAPAGVSVEAGGVGATRAGATPAPDACFYTDDHYRSFSRIRE